MATRVLIGDVELRDFELPERLPFGGVQRLVSHAFPGGGASTQAMGFERRPIEWAGTFLGLEALARARMLEAMCSAGRAVPLTWHDFSFMVLVERFEADFEAHYEVPYTIACRVVSTQEFHGPPQVTQEAAVRSDLQTVRRVVPRIPDDLLAGHVSAFDAAILQINLIARATTAQVQAVTRPLALAQRRLALLAASYANIVRNAATLGGVMPGGAPARMAGAIMGQVTAATGLANLATLGAALTRIGKVFALAESTAGAKSVTVASTSLFDVASREYGDASQWERIARANGLADPVVRGAARLVIPRLG